MAAIPGQHAITRLLAMLALLAGTASPAVQHAHAGGERPHAFADCRVDSEGSRPDDGCELQAAPVVHLHCFLCGVELWLPHSPDDADSQSSCQSGELQMVCINDGPFMDGLAAAAWTPQLDLTALVAEHREILFGRPAICWSLHSPACWLSANAQHLRSGVLIC